jgi:sec-independent protein translocase protein TatB
MFDIGFSELVVIGVVALIVIGPERLPKVARTAGHLYGRMQRYVSAVKSDISREIQLDEIRRAGQSFKDSVESASSSVERQATVVDDYLRNEIGNVKQAVTATAANQEEAAVAEPARQVETEPSPQQSLPLDEPDQNVGRAPSSPSETARSESGEKPA